MPLKKTNGLYRGKVRIGVTQDGKPIDKFVSGKTVKELEVAKEAARDHFIYGRAKALTKSTLCQTLKKPDSSRVSKGVATSPGESFGFQPGAAETCAYALRFRCVQDKEARLQIRELTWT